MNKQSTRISMYTGNGLEPTILDSAPGAAARCEKWAEDYAALGCLVMIEVTAVIESETEVDSLIQALTAVKLGFRRPAAPQIKRAVVVKQHLESAPQGNP